MLIKVLASIGLIAMGMHLFGPPNAPPVMAPDTIASRFSAEIETFVAGLDAETEAFSVRINRCEGRLGELSDQIYYVWVGWRGLAADRTAGKQLAALRSHWSAIGWDIFRDRELDNGGINLAAIEPVSSNSYSLDSGFETGPESYIVGYFNTPCFSSPTVPVVFGSWR